MPRRAAGIDDQLFTAGAVPHSLTGEQHTAMAAFHEAGHGLIYRTVDIPVSVVTFTASGSGASGHTRWNIDDGGEHPFPYWVAGHLAGQVAAELYLEHEHAALPGNLLISHLQSAHDYQQLFHLRLPIPMILYYGACEPLPVKTAAHIEIDAMRAATREILEDLWPTVRDLAAHLLAHGHATPSLLAELPRGTLTARHINDLLDAAVTGDTREPEAGQS